MSGDRDNAALQQSHERQLSETHIDQMGLQLIHE